jgi:hypothetical protein
LTDIDVAASPARLIEMLNGLTTAQVLHVVAELGIADLLTEGPRTSDELALATATHAGALYRLLRVAASLGILAESESRSFNLAPMGQFFRSDHPQSVRGWAVYTGGPVYWGTWQHLGHSIATGQSAFRHLYGMSLWEYMDGHPEAQEIFDAAMTSRISAQRAAVVEVLDFAPGSTIVDVGGGAGALLAAILCADPDARGILYDQPQVVSGADQILRSAGVTERCATIAGSMFESVPAGGDIYVLSSVVHDWDDEHAVEILRTCRRAMSTDARLVLVEQVVGPPNVPERVKTLDLHMLLMHGGQKRTEAEFEALLKASGFRLDRIIPTSALVSLIEGAAA